MSSDVAAPAVGRIRRAQQDPAWVRWGLISIVLSVVGLLIVVPVVNIFVQALSEGLGVYFQNLFMDPDTRHSMLLTATVVPIVLVANVIFGVAAAWSVARFDFPGRTLLIALVGAALAGSGRQGQGRGRRQTLGEWPA